MENALKNEPGGTADKKALRNYILMGCIALLLATNLLVVGIMQVNGESMYPTYDDGSVILVNRLNGHQTAYKRYSVVIIDTGHPGPNKQIIKRIVGLPGDTVLIEEGVVIINGAPLAGDEYGDPILYAGLAAIPRELGVGEYFVLGDNRNVSVDSRDVWLGVVNIDSIIGTPILTLWA